MTMNRLIVIVTLALIGLVLLHEAKAQLDNFPFVKRQGATKYCGQRLSNTLQLVCNGLYNSMFKKSDPASDPDQYQYAYEDPYPFRRRAIANAMMGRFGGGRFRRESRGVHDECCVKSCTINELLSYCAK